MDNQPEEVSDSELAHSLMELLAFHHYGRKPAPKKTPPLSEMKPALLFPHQDLSTVRYDYPVCLLKDDAETPAKPLRRLVDEAAAAGGEGDQAERLKLSLGRLESSVKRLLDAGKAGKLAELLDGACEALAAKNGGDQKPAGHRRELKAAAEKLAADAEVIGFGADAPLRLMSAAGAFIWRKRCRDFRDELGQLLIQVRNVLHADFRWSPEASSAKHLETALAGQPEAEIDFQEMSSLLKKTRPGATLPKGRRKRIEAAFEELEKSKDLFTLPEGGDDASLRPDWIFRDCRKAAEKHRSMMKSLTGFFRAVRIARLEVENRYSEELHDAFFAEFGPAHLSHEEVALCPPVTACVKGDSLGADERSALIEILASGVPVKVLVTVDDAGGLGETPEGAAHAAWTARLASMGMAQNRAFILQGVQSNAEHLILGMLEGFEYAGPALFSVYSGEGADRGGLHPYFVSASALQSRAFPAFIFNPGKGATWLERFSLGGNPLPEKRWTSGRLTARDEVGAEVTLDSDFTFADFAAVDGRCAGHFLPVARKDWHESLIPLSEFMSLDEAAVLNKVPYILMIDGKGRLWRVAVSRSVAQAARDSQMDWRSLQELGGINNSHVLKVIGDEKARLEAEKTREVSAIEDKFKAELDRNVGGLTSEIIQRIAAVLISPGAAAAGPPPALGFSLAPAAAPAAGATAVAEKPPAVEEEEEEEISLDEAYITTPLCTSCDDCTKRNPLMFAYNKNKQAIVKDASAGSFRDMVMAAEACPVKIIHPGKPTNPDEPGLDDLIKRAAKFR